MSTLYEKISSLCKERGIKGGKMCTDLGISKSILTDLKAGRKKGLNAETADKIASYFGVSVGYLLGTEQKEKPLVNNDEELTEYLDMLRNRSEMRMLFSTTKTATKAQIEAIVKMVEEMQSKK
jgi:transcriptional regulator with XRE-family HTH domain